VSGIRLARAGYTSSQTNHLGTPPTSSMLHDKASELYLGIWEAANTYL
jgi:hypothetical protein